MDGDFTTDTSSNVKYVTEVQLTQVIDYCERDAANIAAKAK